MDRIIRFGATEGCRACKFEAPSSRHTNICRARFNGLIRAEKIPASSTAKVSEPKTPAPPVPVPETPALAPLTPTTKPDDKPKTVPTLDEALGSEVVPAEEEEEEEVDPASFSA